MMKQIKIETEIQANQKCKLLQMIHKAFEEHLKNGLEFTCSYYTMEDLEKKVLTGNCFFALCDDEIVGVTSISIDKSQKMAYENISAVHPDYRFLGVGTKLFEIRRRFLSEKKICALISDTSVDAKDSVKWHVDKCGCKIVGYESYASTNYFSYVFREDIRRISGFKKNFVYPIRFFFSYLICKITKKKNGCYTIVGRTIHFFLKPVYYLKNHFSST